MSEQIATVVKVERGRAWVSCERRHGCGSCSQRNQCGTGIVATSSPEKEDGFWVTLTDLVEIGQQIRIGVAQTTLMMSALLLYLLPLCGLMLGAALGHFWLEALWSGGEIITILSAILGATLGFFLSRAVIRLVDERRYTPQMLGKIVETRATYH